jgi:hypothetical protein
MLLLKKKIRVVTKNIEILYKVNRLMPQCGDPQWIPTICYAKGERMPQRIVIAGRANMLIT